ncbi:DUF7471 family protein [Halostella salina]|uniref:DUF7471 family protein n=1 Tax=Halostella salina TaxID=1547897 RepID=UPI000EF82F7C|nr:hypothetical protein [Halostella salina]
MNALHASPAAGDTVLVVVVGLAAVASAVVLGLALAALLRRRSRSYLLVALALATLVARTGIVALTMAGVVADPTHHLIEHVLDVVMAGLVIAAVYAAREPTPEVAEGDL